VAAAEPCCELADARAVRTGEHLRVARSLGDTDRRGSGCGRLDDRADLRRGELARPDVGERDAEGRQRRGETVGDRQRIEVTAGRKGVDRHLTTGNVFFDEQRRRARGVERDPHGLRDLA
jgi:hypothetical protein